MALLNESIKDAQQPKPQNSLILLRPKKQYIRKALIHPSASVIKLKEKQESAIVRHFNELDTQLCSVSGGKISLNTVSKEKKSLEHTETVVSQTFELDHKFTENVRIRLAELKLKEDYFRLKKLYRIMESKKTIF